MLVSFASSGKSSSLNMVLQIRHCLINHWYITTHYLLDIFLSKRVHRSAFHLTLQQTFAGLKILRIYFELALRGYEHRDHCVSWSYKIQNPITSLSKNSPYVEMVNNMSEAFNQMVQNSLRPWSRKPIFTSSYVW